jgi:S-adenosylmethionine decarboxylase
MLKQFDLNNYLFGVSASDLSDDSHQEIRKRLSHEMLEIFYGRNMPM